MPDSIVQIEGVGNVQFPASMSEDEIGQAAHKLYTGAAAKNIEASPPSIQRPSDPVQQEISDRATAGLAGAPGGAPITPPASDEAIKVAGAGLGAAALGTGMASGAIPTMARKVAPFILPATGSYAINKARHIPFVGPIIDKIPFAEALPWLIGGKGKGAEAEAVEGEALGIPTKELEEKVALPNPTVEKARGLGLAERGRGRTAAQTGEALGTTPSVSSVAGSFRNPRSAATPSVAIPTGGVEGSAIGLKDPARTRLKVTGTKELSTIGKQRGIDLTAGQDPGATGAVAGRDTAVDAILGVLSPEELAALRQH